MWLQHLSGLLAATVTVCHAIEKKGRPVLVHCSDGWDRTPQIVATAQLCLDPFYRTVEGFRILVEREWLSFGHKFSDRCGHGPGSDELNERCPVFLQWLDLVHQIHKQFPCSFEFNMAYLIKLAQHSNSCLFGTFLCNTYKERLEKSVFERTFSVWPFLSGPMYKNPLYIANRDTVIWPAHHVRDLYLWTDIYLGSLGNQNSTDFPNNSNESLQDSMSPLIKTRSYGDLISANIIQNGISRRSSDPNMIIEPNLILATDSGNNSIADTHSEREDTPDKVNETIQKIQNLTMQLNHQDEDIFMNVRKTGSNELQKHEQREINRNTFHEETNASISSYQTEENDSTNNTQNSANTNRIESQGINPNHMARKAFDNIAVRDSGSREHLETYCEVLKNDLTMNINLGGLDTSRKVAAVLESESDSPQNIWHGSVNTSTDTLVPIERRITSDFHETKSNDNDVKEVDVTDSFDTPEKFSTRADKTEAELTSPYVLLKQERKSLIETNANANDVNGSILPKVHGNNSNSTRSNILSNLSINASASSSLFSVNFDNINKTNISNISNSNNKNKALAKTTPTAATMEPSGDSKFGNDVESGSEIDPNGIAGDPFSINSHTHSSDSMNESIIILPEHRKLEISVSGKCETVSNNGSSMPTTPTGSATILNGSVTGDPAGRTTANVGVAIQRRRRTSSSNSNPNRNFDGFNSKLANGSTTTRFSLPGARSLPMTPPAQPERPQITISCPDGLAHALSEQNLRLQQIVLEHKVREDVLLREIHDMRMVLLKKICPNCNVAQTNTNDEQCSALDNIENASICSWEAVEDRSAPSSSGSSSIQQPSTTSALWVPDHAVKRCTSCQVEFWIGRRRHHCRSCGQIFCADCSEFWAPLPDAKLFNPVRLCGPCYHAVTTKIQQQSRMVNTSSMPNPTTSNSISTSANITCFTSSGGASINLSSTTVTASDTIDVTATSTKAPESSSKENISTLPITTAAVLQQQHRQSAVSTASATVAAAAAATSTQIESSSMSHMLMVANKNIAASVAN